MTNEQKERNKSVRLKKTVATGENENENITRVCRENRMVATKRKTEKIRNVRTESTVKFS